MAGSTVEGDVDGAVVERVATAGPGVVGREHAAQHGDDGKAMATVVAQRVDVPPEVAARRDRPVEPRSASSAAAAIRPERAVIGTPGPGCTLPPARYRPGIRVRTPGRSNDAFQPCEALP